MMTIVMKVALAALLLEPAAASAGQSAPAGTTLAQYLPREKKKMLKLDTDKDGRISSTEYDARKAPDPKKKAKRFKREDADQNGFIDDAEMAAQVTREFRNKDKNGDGVLSADERKAGRKRPAAAQ